VVQFEVPFDKNGNIDNPILLRYELKKEAKREWIRK